ncbi:hypothetical protein [Larkinella rosea]|uniref:DUF998 domain-containing protein n=1 Tax=Larkinella rosea TaxID=2025312 RepID=A0A3P1BJR9_9BACT|nr:hypothetical protein [Larkinella rosea]RRB01176.1 hypothetical protein EHT25_23670 [Larkinella rosea]
MALLEYNSNPKAPEKPVVSGQDTIRIIIGLLGFFLPFILVGGLFVYSCYPKPLSSISHYYYTRVGSIFCSTLGILAVVLLAYKGKKLIDFIFSTTAAVFAMLVVILPTNIGYKDARQLPPYFATFIADNCTRSTVHFTSAGIFLGSLALMSLLRFPKDDSSDEKPKPLDIFMYRASGLVMIVSMLIILLGANGWLIDKKWFEDHQGIFWGEAVAVCTFGYSWLLKAGFFSKTANLAKNIKNFHLVNYNE